MDDTPVKFRLDTYRGEVVVWIDRPLSWLSLPPATARALAVGLTTSADQIDPPPPPPERTLEEQAHEKYYQRAATPEVPHNDALTEALDELARISPKGGRLP